MHNRFGSLMLSVALIIGFLWAVTTKEAHAYIDPGTGSFMIQILLASLFASIFALKVFWQRFTGRIARILSSIRGIRHTQNPEQ